MICCAHNYRVPELTELLCVPRKTSLILWISPFPIHTFQQFKITEITNAVSHIFSPENRLHFLFCIIICSTSQELCTRCVICCVLLWLRSKSNAGRVVANDISIHDDVIKWKHFPRYWPSVRGIHRWPANSPHKGHCRGALMFSFICAWISDWVNNREVGVLTKPPLKLGHGWIITSCCFTWM